MTDLHWTEVDHVITVWTDAPAPLRAGLLFRTGRADETLVTAGLTHLIEHMALSSIVGDATSQHNGLVSGALTGFFTLGQPHEVASFFARLCDVLKSLPADRLDSEKQVLAAESATRAYDFRSNLLVWRYGAVGYGQLGMPEFGIQASTQDHLQEFASQRFTSGNAILWLSGPPPADLRLGLPQGKKQPLPPLVPIQRTFPRWFMDNGSGGVAAGATVPRVSAASLFGEIASRRLRKRLRIDQAISYAPAVFYDYLDAQTAHLVLYADSEQSNRVELANVFGEVFKELDTVDEAEVVAARNQILEYWTGSLTPPLAERNLMEVQRAALDWILDKEFESLELNASQLQSVTASDVAAFGREVKSTALFALPAGAALHPWYGHEAPFSKARMVQGRKFIYLDAPVKQVHLIHGQDGVSVIGPDGSHRTVRYADLAAALYYKDGGVLLIASDAATIMIEPTLWRDGRTLCHQIREQIPPHLVLDQYPRPANSIPKPTTTAWQRFRSRLTQH